MFLHINTTSHDLIELKLVDGEGTEIAKKEIKVNRDQAEKLLPAIDKILKDQDLTIQSLEKIIVKNGSGGFSSLRIGIVTANTLAYALGIEVEDDLGNFKKTDNLQIVEPKYDREASVTLKK